MLVPDATMRVRWSHLPRLVVVLVLVAIAIEVAGAGSGELDLTFAEGDGLFVGMMFSRASAVAIQDDGRIVVGGAIGANFALVRLLPDGTPDPTFGTGGLVTTDFGGTEEIRDIAIQPDGRIVAVGSSVAGVRRFAVARYNTDGTLDTTFDVDGKVLTAPTGRAGEATAVALQADGSAVKIVVAGTAFTGGALTDEDVAVVRYNPDGSPDLAFNGTGHVVVVNFGRAEFAASIAVQSDGKIVVGGTADNPENGTLDFLLARFDATGFLDTTFGIATGTGGYKNGGQVTTDFAPSFAPPIVADDTLGKIAIQPDGMIVAGGAVEDQDTGAASFALARYEVDGALDLTFGTGGRVHGPAGWGSALALQPDAKILLGGFAGGTRDFALARYHDDGSLDASFGTAGMVTTNLGGSDAVHALAVQADRRIVAAGTTVGSFGDRIAVARYLGGDTTPPTIEAASVSPAYLWPPNHKFVPVTVAVTATDDGGTATCAISGIASSEPATGPNDDTAPDWMITGSLTASLRAERANGPSGRSYTIGVECVDGAGNTATTEVVVRVSHSEP